MKYPIDIEANLTALYKEREEVETHIKIIRRICELENLAYGFGRNRECIPPDIIAGMQGIAAALDGSEVGAEITFLLMRNICEAHAQGRRDTEEQEGRGEIWVN